MRKVQETLNQQLISSNDDPRKNPPNTQPIDTYQLASFSMNAFGKIKPTNDKQDVKTEIEILNFGPLRIEVIKDPKYPYRAEEITKSIKRVFSNTPEPILKMLADYYEEQFGNPQITICLCSPENGSAIIRKHTKLNAVRAFFYSNNDNGVELFGDGTKSNASIHNKHKFIVYWLRPITIFSNPEQTIAHEIGHAVAFMLGSKFDKDLQKIYKLYMKETANVPPEDRRPRKYSTSNHEEFWADLFGYALLDQHLPHNYSKENQNYRHIIKAINVAIKKSQTKEEFALEICNQLFGM